MNINQLFPKQNTKMKRLNSTHSVFPKKIQTRLGLMWHLFTPGH